MRSVGVSVVGGYCGENHGTFYLRSFICLESTTFLSTKVEDAEFSGNALENVGEFASECRPALKV
jgi:hypothetical protein